MIKALLFVLFVPLFVIGALTGIFADPWAPWLVTATTSPPIVVNPEAAARPLVRDPLDLNPFPGASLSDAQRYQLARLAGFSPADAIIATAISIAENGSGNPGATSGRNQNGTYDLGMWQINTIWWAQFGGEAALRDPWRNAQAAYYIKGRQGWCAWSTYGPGCEFHGCGVSPASCYRTYLPRAEAASRVVPPQGEV